MFTDTVDTWTGYSDAEFDTRLRELELQRRTLDAAMAAAIAVGDARQINQIDGHCTMKGYLRATCNWSNAEVARWRSMARAVNAVPGLGDTWTNGRFGLPQAVEFAKAYGNRRVRDRLGEFAPILLQQAETLPYDDFRIAMAEFVNMADQDGAFNDTQNAIDGRNARVIDVGGALDARATGGDPLTTAEIEAIFDEFCDDQFQHDLTARKTLFGDDADNHHLARSSKQRRYDAFVNIFRTAHTARAGGIAAPGPTEALINILIDDTTWGQILATHGLAPDQTLTGDTIDPFTGLTRPADLLNEMMDNPQRLLDRSCETSTGIQLHPTHVLQAALAGHVRRIVVNSRGVTINQGRSSRLFTGAARQAALLLLRRCEHDGCDLPAQLCQVDHATEWYEGGQTNQEDARGRCGSHNRFKHYKRLKSKRATNGRTYTIRPDGTIMLPAGVRPPTLVDEIANEDHPPADNTATDNPPPAESPTGDATLGEESAADPMSSGAPSTDATPTGEPPGDRSSNEPLFESILAPDRAELCEGTRRPGGRYTVTWHDWDELVDRWNSLPNLEQHQRLYWAQATRLAHH